MQSDPEQTRYDACPVCSGAIKPWRVKKAGSDQYALDLCASCGYCFVNPRPSLSFLTEFYCSSGRDRAEKAADVADAQSVVARERRYPNSTLDARRLIRTIKSLLQDGGSKRFLDVGCGYGFFSKEALDAGFEVAALELAPNERRITRELTGLDPAACSFEEFQCAPASLRAILMSQILEHALDVNLWLEKAREFLVDGGILAVALPNFGSVFRRLLQENDPYICPPAHLNFFSPASLTRLMEKHGFRVQAVQWVSRIPTGAVEKRLPRVGKPLLPGIAVLASMFARSMDVLHLGVMINVYGRKIAFRQGEWYAGRQS